MLLIHKVTKCGELFKEKSGQALFAPLKLRSEGLFPACAAQSAAADLHSASSAERLFPARRSAPVIDSRALRGPAPPVAFHRRQRTPAAVLLHRRMSPTRPSILRVSPSSALAQRLRRAPATRRRFAPSATRMPTSGYRRSSCSSGCSY